MTLAEQDHKKYLSARDSAPAELLAYAAKASGRKTAEIAFEFRRINKSHSRLNLVEYVRNGLFHADRFTDEDRAKFISNDLHWPITHTCNNQGWQSTAEDKLVAETILRAGGVAVPETLAVFDKGPRIYPGIRKVDSAEALRAFLTEAATAPLFGKIVEGMVSFGAFRVERVDDTHIHCAGHAPMTFEAFWTDLVGDSAYVVQRALSNHAGFAQYASALATVRMVTMVTPTGVLTPMSVIKLPQGDNIADAFWRPGNLACDIDIETGRIQTVARRGIETEFLEDHPETPGLMGLELPFWQDLVALNETAARLFAPIRYQSTDIAITDQGPVLVELNYGGGFDLPQYASGRGMLTQEVRAFFEGCGVDLSPPKKRGFRLPFLGR